MAKVLHSRVNGLGEANALFTFGAGQTDVYVEFRIMFSGDALTEFASLGNFFFMDATGGGGSGAEGLFLDTPGNTLETWWATNGPFGSLLVDTWYTFRMRARIVAGDIVTDFYIDGVSVGAIVNDTSPPAFTSIDNCFFGWANSAPATACDIYIDDIKISAVGFGSADIFSADFEDGLIDPPFDSTTVSGSGVLEVVDDPNPPAPGPTPTVRFFRDYPWRFVVTELDHTTLTFLDTLATDRNVVLAINEPAQANAVVPADNPEVNIPSPGPNDDPFVHHNNRFLLGFRREGGTPKWKIRFCGLIMQVNDVAADTPTCRIAAYDPWEYLNHRPVLRTDGNLPGPNGISWKNTRGDVIALEILGSTYAFNGTFYADFGQSTDFGGTIEATPQIDIKFDQGTTVGEALTQLCDSGTLDIWFEPIYEPISRPGILCEVNIFQLMGSAKYNAVFAWDKPSRNLVGVDRQWDGSQMANIVQYYAGQGGPAVTTAQILASIGKYGQWWSQQAFPGKTKVALVELLAIAQAQIRAEGARTLQFEPAPEISPIPFLDYFIGDEVQFATSKRLRQKQLTLERVHGMNITIDDDGVELVRPVLTADESFST